MTATTNAYGEFQPGDVFREYPWRPDGKWQRVTGPDATHEGAQKFLPNAVNTVSIDDLEGATRIDAVIEMLLCHGGTANKRIREFGTVQFPRYSGNRFFHWLPLARVRERGLGGEGLRRCALI